ncbi:NAD-dependent epimerase/dehydratase family protein [Candidatus Dependentiae bacterium]|nr:NAD-dependent epimerase/dehydratase family protein [Candidatus Dependentiae bacterium]
MKKYMVLFGSNGYFGHYICQELITQGYNVIAFKFPHFRSTIIEHPDVEYFEFDIRTDPADKKEYFKKIFEGKSIKGLINAAALLGASDYDSNYKTNALGVKNLAELAKMFNIPRFVHVSTVCVIKPIKGPYGIAKMEGDNFLKNSGINYTIFIPALLLGVESLGLGRILKNVFKLPFFVPLIGGGKETQHPIYIKDFAHYIVKCVETEKCINKIYQIGGDTVISFKEFVEMILKFKNRKKIFITFPVFIAKIIAKYFQLTQKRPLFTLEHIKGILQDSNLDTSELVKDLNFKPTPLNTALKECLDKLGDNWNYYLNGWNERVIKIGK